MDIRSPSPTGGSVACRKIMTDSGLEHSTFSASVAHGIHSISVEHLNTYFDGKVSEDNSIPTTNTDLKSDQKVLMFAPKMNKDPGMLTDSMQMLDFILRNNDDAQGDDFYFPGVSSLEKLAHFAHMDEIYARTKPVYKEIIKHPPKDSRLCGCVRDDKNNGIHQKLAHAFQKYLDYSHFLPKIVSPQTWKEWIVALTKHMLTKKERYNLAMYLYCKLKAKRMGCPKNAACP